MWQRSDLKYHAKSVLQYTYWKSVLAALIFTIAGGGTVLNYTRKFSRSYHRQYGYQFDFPGAWPYFLTLLSGLLFLSLGIALVTIILKIFVLQPLQVGAQRFFIINGHHPASLEELGFAFRTNYLNVVKVEFLRNLFIFLWSLLFVIPGIIKAYEYRMIPFILAENPDIDYSEAFRLSKAMMDGEKGAAFVLDLSFIPWILLIAVTCGIVGVFYVNPYICLTNMELYTVLKQKIFGPGYGQNPGGQADSGNTYQI